jgi:hypothetical protein
MGHTTQLAIGIGWQALSQRWLILSPNWSINLVSITFFSANSSKENKTNGPFGTEKWF